LHQADPGSLLNSGSENSWQISIGLACLFLWL
jgi:hypothetical protein